MTVTLTNPLRVGLRQERVISPQCLVIFGASGDLTHRKLVPALFELFRQRRLPTEFAVLGCARRPWSDDDFRGHMAEALGDVVREHLGAWEQFASGLFYEPVDLQQPEHLVRLAQRLEVIDRQRATRNNRTFYLSVSPKFYGSGCRALAAAGLLSDDQRSRVVIEKPFGRDYGSAQELNRIVQESAKESQVFRIDHYLGKETVQNILVLRFANTIFEPIWNRNYIASVEITAAETVGVEERAGYYESSGALRDMVQNHLTQMLALTTMEAPGRFEPEAIRNEKAKVLQSARLADELEPWNCCVRGQYGPGGNAARPLPGYREEPGVNPNSTTETYVAMKLFIDNWRWQGVPFYLRTGKRLPKRMSEVVLTFREAPVHLFDAAGGSPTANQLILRIQPDEGAGFRFEVKSPGSGMRSRPVDMHFSYDESFGEPSDEGYVRLLADAMLGDPTLFTRGDEVEAAWRLYTPLLELIEDSPWQLPVHPYEARTWGPAASDNLLGRDGLIWRRP
ncbi:glucose-6-phosphate dehydrogenase [Synechococcus sp. BSF8S]|uniref:glucose-6-phosphate dehydrogenase n=1 Tax=Synechococcales TaxID=1890424 RepID=UPI00162AA2CE|nr:MULTISPECIES: glucose-6-phosphate dehydrogenase [unclassified Synechococcus]MBC1260032.1 glucose-6-phosphate dehydrogenase [Synechococcus sp. BSF8S]MBC1263151.1 glucose-6-phosphate dehydrogenase [Synechococcus sp. BSA11S]